jgi:hypothetical protein
VLPVRSAPDSGRSSPSAGAAHFEITRKRQRRAPQKDGVRQRLTFLYREVSTDTLQIPPLEVEIAA